MHKLLGAQWALLDGDKLPAALCYGPVDYDVRNKYVYELMRNDLLSNHWSTKRARETENNQKNQISN